MAEMVVRMERNGWITRTPSMLDARAYSVRLAAAGATLLAAATHHARAADAAILDALPRTKRRTFLSILAKLAKVSEEAAERAERDARKQAKKDKRAQLRQTKADNPRKSRR
jgi:DNA-binding MarR family transcriptional regulator